MQTNVPGCCSKCIHFLANIETCNIHNDVIKEHGSPNVYLWNSKKKKKNDCKFYIEREEL